MPGPRNEGGAGSPRALLESHLDEIEAVVSWISRRFCMRADEAEEFRSWVHLKLIEEEYRILRRFSGRSSLATYLNTVIQNLARDYRTSRWGRWRPSAAAERLGLVAVQLEALTGRDGFSFDEAVEMLRANHGVRQSRAQLAELAAKLPARVRPRFEGDDAVAAAASSARADDAVEEAERLRVLTVTRRVLERCLAELELEDRLILQMHYQAGLTIAAVAAALDLAQRRLYTRRERCYRQLRICIAAGLPDAATALEALGWAGADFELDYGTKKQEDERTAPSNSTSVGDEEKR